ncbi:MAG: hypothetical protein ABI704_26340 [Kofleriaceae bacterium]
MAKQITLRNVPTELATRLANLAATRGQSLNSTVLVLLERATGIDGRRERLARYTTWTHQDVRDFEEALHAQRTIDRSLWS